MAKTNASLLQRLFNTRHKHRKWCNGSQLSDKKNLALSSPSLSRRMLSDITHMKIRMTWLNAVKELVAFAHVLKNIWIDHWRRRQGKGKGLWVVPSH